MKYLPPLESMKHFRASLLPPKTRSTPNLTLLLDLDQTLVHCELAPIENPSFEFSLMCNEVEYHVYGRIRPFCREFLEWVSERFEVVVFTASRREYAEKVVKILDPEKKMIRHALFRDSCLAVGDEDLLIKELGVLGREPGRVMLVDNSPSVFSYQVFLLD